MRMLPLLVALPLWAAPALAQPPSPPPHPVATQPAAPTQAAPAPQKQPHHHVAPWERRFARANTTHDGHLTLAQAIRGYITIARHFRAIDTNHKGYVTLQDVRAWHAERRAARHRRLRHHNAEAHGRSVIHQTSSIRTEPPPI